MVKPYLPAVSGGGKPSHRAVEAEGAGATVDEDAVIGGERPRVVTTCFYLEAIWYLTVLTLFDRYGVAWMRSVSGTKGTGTGG